MERVLQGVAAQISQTFYNPPGTVADPGAVTVTVRSDDGTALVTNAPASGTGATPRTFTLTPTMTALLDSLSVSWTSPSLGTPPADEVEVVGGFFFTVADMRKRLADATTYPNADVETARTWAESEIENACGVAFVPRYASETLSGTGQQRLEPKWPRVRSLRAATVDGSPLTTSDLSGVVVELERFLTRPYAYWRPWVSNVTIRYEHGMDSPPPGISAAALDLARYKLVSDAGQSGVDPRAERLVTDDGTLTLGMAGQSGRFGIPSVDAAVEAWSELAIW